MPGCRHGRRGRVPGIELDADDPMDRAYLDRRDGLRGGFPEQRRRDVQEQGEKAEKGFAAHAPRYTTRPAAR
jgi:hypothetical protein